MVGHKRILPLTGRRSRVQFAAFIGATAEEVAIIPYASAGTNSVASAAQLRELISGKRVSSLERPHERVESPRT